MRQSCKEITSPDTPEVHPGPRDVGSTEHFPSSGDGSSDKQLAIPGFHEHVQQVGWAQSLLPRAISVRAATAAQRKKATHLQLAWNCRNLGRGWVPQARLLRVSS